MTILEALRIMTEHITAWVNDKFFKKGEATADDFGIYVQPNNPTNAIEGDIWIDTDGEPSIITVPTNYSDLIFSGAVNATYNGSKEVEVVIPDAPSKMSDLTNDVGFITEYVETDPTVPSWAKATEKPAYTATEVGADATGTAASKVSSHNTDGSAHNDIRLVLQELTNKINAFLDSDDTTLDELTELITAIQNNQNTISQLTSNKVNVADIVNNLTTNASNKPLSAAQGVAIKKLIDAITVPSKTSQLTNDSGFITGYTETDPTVPSWAKASKKPTYTASEVGALPSTTVIPTKLSDLAGDSTHRIVTDTEKSTWNAKSNFSGNYNDLSNKPTIPSIAGLASETYVNNQIAAIPTPDVSGQISTHNAATNSHNDIRLLIEGLTTRLNTLANSDDTTLDQMSEVVAYIKSNKSLIDAITTNKVNVSDIVNNLTSNVSNKPLSAAQGVALKALIDKITVPTKVSQLTNDSGYITGYTETDPTVPSWAKASTKPSYTKSEVGLGNVDNTSDTNKPVSTAQATAIADAKKAGTDAQSNLTTHINNKSNPHSVTKSQVGLSNVDNVKQYSANNPPPYPVKSVNGATGAVTINALPTVTTADNGKVLMVINGAWKAVELNMSIDDNGVVYI